MKPFSYKRKFIYIFITERGQKSKHLLIQTQLVPTTMLEVLAKKDDIFVFFKYFLFLAY